MKALVLSITAGQGHNATAKAICAYLESIGCDLSIVVARWFIPLFADVGRSVP